ncbi:hypothetical protein [Azospirillum brasilense]|uniref:Uncharacterized protein n=1 Tax=Azospirillum brasilense TaxID=192 RepID=A0A6L3AU45_AZOBR|nr:hypothetical protein [Azospirillum brasilense]KAA0679640.1 hypothetical protein DS837_25625 [Azospirillum brasilense]
MKQEAIGHGLAVTLAALMLAGCDGALSHIETQKRLDAAFAGFPPVLDDPVLSRYRAAYLTDKAAYDANPDAVLGLDSPARACDLPEDTRHALADRGFQLRVYERNPGFADYMAKHGQGFGTPVYDRVTVRRIDGDCSGGALDGPADIVMTYLRLTPHGQLGSHKVYEMVVRESCTFRGSLRDGPCKRIVRTRHWSGQFTKDGRLVTAPRATYETMRALNAPGLTEPNDEDFITTTTRFDYGPYAAGREAGPGVAFETTPIAGDGVNAVENNTLTRQTLPDGRVRYTEYMGGTVKATYRLRGGVPDGELVWSVPQPGGEQRECFVDGEKVLTRNCGA